MSKRQIKEAKLSLKPRKEWKKIGTKEISILKIGTRETKTIRRVIYREKTLTRWYPIYWFQLTPNNWTNTTREGVRNGVTVDAHTFQRLKYK